jgi:hypothetical protein
MSKQLEKVKITASILPKSDEKMRLRAVREKLSLGELLEKYQDAYEEKLEREKADKSLEKKLLSSYQSRAKNEEMKDMLRTYGAMA